MTPVGQDRAFLVALDELRTLASTDIPVLIEGETGTGKEVLAQYLHELSPRARQPFVGAHCAALPVELFESELFGHIRGSFTGAMLARSGLMRAAHRGTLLLDDLSDLPLSCQAKLLRPLQEGEVRPVGSDRPQMVDVRVVATSNRAIAPMVDRGDFRADLFFRLRSGLVTIPPLRQRPGDPTLLARHFLGRLGFELDPGAAEVLEAYDWPGNVRELEHAVARIAAFVSGSVVTKNDVLARLVPVARGADTPLERRLRTARGTRGRPSCGRVPGVR